MSKGEQNGFVSFTFGGRPPVSSPKPPSTNVLILQPSLLQLGAKTPSLKARDDPAHDIEQITDYLANGQSC